MPIKPYNGPAIQNVSIVVINCQSICNKPDETSDVVKHMDLNALVITETWHTACYTCGFYATHTRKNDVFLVDYFS